MRTSTLAISNSHVAEPLSSYGMTVTPPTEQLIEVLVDLAMKPNTLEESPKLFTYRVPADLEVQPGDIISVPFGSQQIGAIAIRFVTNLPDGLTREQLKDIDDIITPGFFPPTYWQLLEKVANYYCTPLIQVIRTALPPGLLGRSQRRVRLIPENIPADAVTFLNPGTAQLLTYLQQSKTGDYSWQHLQRQVKGAKRGLRDLLKRGYVASYLEPPSAPKPKLKQAITLVASPAPIELTTRQTEVWETLRRRGGEMWLQELIQTCQTSTSVIKALQEKGYVVITEQELLRVHQGIEQTPDVPKTLNCHQATALETIQNLSGFAQVLLHGITGSGKTEVYLQAIAPILAQGQSAIILVPEIGLTPQLTDRFRSRFGDQVCVYHSALSDGERYDTWRHLIRGLPQVVIGTRSAIFAPLPNIGMIILDEEHDSSFKQDQPPPCYHARTVAQWRAELINCPLILGSATPSLETWLAVQCSQSSPSHYLSLPERVYARPLPPVEVVDMRQELRKGNRSIFSQSLQTALTQLAETRQQGILFIHRRGHSTFISCRSCGYVMECPHCDVSLSYHHIHEQATQLLRCHYCNHTQLYPQRCPECDSPYFKHFGSGTQRVAQALKDEFPQLRFIRYDSDTTRTKDAHRILLTRFMNQEADLLIGTQMLSKGLDLASVSLVGIISADGLLNLPDYRASERAFQTLLQVAGRAGRGEDPGQVILQTYTPEHAVIQAVKTYQYQPFVETELEQRSILNYPPYGRLILLRMSGYDAVEVEQAANQLADACRELLDGAGFTYNLLGPAPAPILRVANRYRWHLLIKTCQEVSTQHIPLSQVRDRCPRSVSLTIDIDPLNLG